MSQATRRGISDHAIAELHERIRMRLRHLDLMGQADRVTYVITLMCSDDRVTAKEAIAAADRRFPITQTGRDDEQVS
jgi:hypothetical protein